MKVWAIATITGILAVFTFMIIVLIQGNFPLFCTGGGILVLLLAVSFLILKLNKKHLPGEQEKKEEAIPEASEIHETAAESGKEGTK